MNVCIYKHTYPGSPSQLLFEWVFHKDYEGGYSIYYIHIFRHILKCYPQKTILDPVRFWREISRKYHESFLGFLPHSIPLMEEIMHHQASVVNMMSESSTFGASRPPSLKCITPFPVRCHRQKKGILVSIQYMFCTSECAQQWLAWHPGEQEQVQPPPRISMLD